MANPPCTSLSGPGTACSCGVREVSVLWEQQQHESNLYSSITSMGVDSSLVWKDQEEESRGSKHLKTASILSQYFSPNSDPIPTTCKSH